ncbi:MAG: ankyrin repeat domain-containing protein [Myxococcaceae bacterium]|nr:ankyrin repeat domain-containing protein [Myxococcaceae bacterium]
MSGGNWKDLFAAGCRGDLELVRYHVEAGVDVNYCHPEFLCPPLVGAILEKQEAVALYLLEHGARWDVPSEMDDGLNALGAARRVGLEGLAARLVALGATDSGQPGDGRLSAPPPWWQRVTRWLGGRP